MKIKLLVAAAVAPFVLAAGLAAPASAAKVGRVTLHIGKATIKNGRVSFTIPEKVTSKAKKHPITWSFRLRGVNASGAAYSYPCVSQLTAFNVSPAATTL